MMILPSDEDYKTAKKIIQGKETMTSEFNSLAEWIDATYDVKTINIISDIINNSQRPRLQICFEFENERLKFLDKKHQGFDRVRQKEIADKYNEIIQKQSPEKNHWIIDFFKSKANPQYSAKDIFIVFSAFEPIAMIEANESVPQSVVNKLKESLANQDLWEISRRFSGTTFFVYTDLQVEKYENSETKKEWAQKYFDLLEKYNEFGYFKRDNFSIYIDSKENLDKNYQSSWFYYYR